MDIVVREPGKPFRIGPFEIEMVRAAHSIPEGTSLAIRTPVGLVVHTGDWKLDEFPGVSWPTDEERFRQLGEEGVLDDDTAGAIAEFQKAMEVAETGEPDAEIRRLLVDEHGS